MNIDASQHFKTILKALTNNGPEQILIKKFINNLFQHPLPDNDYAIFPGKLSESWAGLEEGSSLYAHARENHLWHYHIGYQTYWKSSKKYKTSEWVIHFIWHKSNRSKCNEIKLVDYTPHKVDGSFPLPNTNKLV